MKNEKMKLRERVLSDTDALDGEYIRSCDGRVFDNLISLPEFIAAKTVLAYFGVGREVSTVRMIEHALEYGKTVCLPESLPGGVMRAVRIGALSDLVPGKFGIPAPPDGAEIIPPEKLDFIIVPAVTFDREGYRLGRGGGYYDRYLPRTRAFTVGLARDALLVERVPRETHDHPVRCVVTETSASRYV